MKAMPAVISMVLLTQRKERTEAQPSQQHEEGGREREREMAQEEGPRAQPSPQRNCAQVYLTPQWDGGLTTPGVSASASAEADSDDEFLQDLWRTPARSSKVSHDDALGLIGWPTS